jgi:pyruvate dehydrogenase E1 component
LYQKAEAGDLRVHLMGSGAILNEVIAAADLLKQDFNISADVFSVTSFVELQRDAAAIYRQMMLQPDRKPAKTYLQQCLKGFDAPIVAATDYVRAYPELIRPYLANPYVCLGTDGYGRSDTRKQLRAFFEVDRYHIVVAALYALMKEGKVTTKKVAEAIKQYQIDPEKPNPITV